MGPARRVSRGGTRLYRRHQRDVAQLLVLAVTSGDELDHGVLLKGERIEMAITPGQSVTFVAVAKDANGFVVTDAVITLAGDNPEVGPFVDNGDKTALLGPVAAMGIVNVTATAQDPDPAVPAVTATVTVTASPGPVASVEITEGTPTP